ncbi:unnamed protein product [Closterium sp. NIES-53]
MLVVVARLAVRSHLPLAERAHFGQYKTAKSLYDAVVARYSSPATAALSRLMLPYLFPDLAAFATVADLITHLRTSDAHYRAALPTEFCAKNPPPIDHFLSLCPTELTVDLLEERLAAAEKSILAVGASRSDRRTPFFEGCSPVPLLPSVASAAAVNLVGTEEVGATSAPLGGVATARARGARVVEEMAGGVAEAVEEVEGVAVEVGVVPGVGASVAVVEVVEATAEVVEATAAVAEVAVAVVLVEVQPRSVEALVVWGCWSLHYVLRTGSRRGETWGLPHTAQRCFGRLNDAWRAQFPDAVELPRWGDLLRQNVAIFDLDFDAILAAMYALTDSAKGDYYLRVPLDPGIEAAALGAGASAAPGTGESAAPGAGESALSGTPPPEALHTFTLDSGASRSFFRDSTTLTPLSRPVTVSLADPSGGPVLAHSSTVLRCPAAPSGLLSGLHLPSFSTSLVSGADLQDAWVDQFTPGGQRVTNYTCSQMGRHLATFTRRPGSSLYTLTTASPPVSASGQVAASSQVFAAVSRSSPASAPCSCRPLSHKTLLWHHRLGHPSLPCLRGMASRTLVSCLPRSLPPLPLRPAPTYVPFVEGWQRATPHSSTFPPIEAPLQTLHMDVWGPARVRGQGHERYFLLVVDDYSRYTTVFPLLSKGAVSEVLIDWIRGARRQLSERFGSDLPVLRLHSDRGGEFSSDLLKTFCRAEGIRQTFMLPASPHPNGIAERRIGMVMDVARTSMIHAAAPHFLWSFAVQYAAHQINLQPRVSLPETTPTLRWTRKVGDASAFRVWGSRAFVHDTLADKLSSRAVPCVFLGFPPDAPGWQFYHPTSRRILSSQDVTFDESVSYYHLFPYRTASLPPPPATLPSSRYSSGAARGAEPTGAGTGGAEPGGAEPERVASGGAEPAGAGTGGADPGGAESERVESGGAEPERVEPGGTASWGAEPARAESGGSPGVPLWCEPFSPQRLREWYARRWRRAAGAAGGVAVGGVGDVGAASTSGKRRSSKGKGGKGGGGGSKGGGGGSRGGGGGSGGGGGGGSGGGSWGFGGGDGDSGGGGISGGSGSGGNRAGAVPRGGDLAGQTCEKPHTQHRCFSRLDDAWRVEFGDKAEHPRWAELLRSRVAIFDLDYDAILTTMYALSVSAEDDYYLCVPPDLGTVAAALGASESAPPSLLSLHLYQSDWVTPQGGQSLPVPPLFSSVQRFRLAHFQVFTSPSSLQTWSGSNPLLVLPPVTLDSSVAPPPYHPSLPRLRGMHSHLLVSGLPRSLPPLPPSPAPPCLPCIEGQQRAAPHSSSFPPTIAPLQTLHMDMWGPARVSGHGRERSFLLVVDHYTRCTTVFPLRSKGERRIGLVMEVARTSMIHAAAPHFLWPFAVRYAAHQLNLWPCVSLLETSPTLCWTREVGNASVFRFYHPNSRRVFPSQDVTFDESVPFYRLFPYRSAPPQPPPLFLAPRPPPVDPLPPQGLAPSGVPCTVPVEVAVDSVATQVEPGGVEPRGTASFGGPAGASPRLSPRPEPLSPQQLREWFAQRTLLWRGAAGARDSAAGDTGAGGVGATCLGGAGVPARAGGTGGAAAVGPRGARTRGTGAAGIGIVGGAGARGAGVGDPAEPRDAGAGGAGAGGTGAGSAGAGGAGAGDTGAVGAGGGGTSTGGAGAGGVGVGDIGAVDPGDGGAGARGAMSGGTGARGTVRLPSPRLSQPQLQQDSPPRAPSPYAEQTDSFGERREPESRLALPVCAVRTARWAPRPHPPHVPGTHAMPLRPSSVPLRVPLLPSPESFLPAAPDPESDLACATNSFGERREPESCLALPVRAVCPACRAPRPRPPHVLGTHAMPLRPSSIPLRVSLPPSPESFLPAAPDPEFDLARATTPTISRLLATVVTDPSFESTTASALVAELVDFAAACRLDYATALVAESESANPPSVGGECALGTDVLENRQEDFECLAAAIPHLVAMLLALEGDPDTPDILTLYSSQWQTAMDAEMASWKSTGTYVDAVPPFGANIVDGNLRRPVYGLRQAPHEWHDTLRTTLVALGFTPSTADPSLFLRTDTSLSPFYVLVYVDDLVFATADTEVLESRVT